MLPLGILEAKLEAAFPLGILEAKIEAALRARYNNNVSKKLMFGNSGRGRKVCFK